MDVEHAHKLARERGVNAVVYWIVRVILQPFFRLYFRLGRIGTEHIPNEGPVLLASNHRSFSDPFIIGTCLGRPLRFVAKAELFEKRWQARLLLALGAFPIRRGESDELALETARAILERGGAVGIFPEGTRVRPGPLAEPKRGIGRLALETGAPVVPVAIRGTEDIRARWRIRPRRVTVRCGRALTFPRPLDRSASPNVASEVAARVWACVQLQWEWLGGMAPIRTAAVVGAGSWGTAAAVLLARGGASVQLGCRTPEQAAALRERGRNEKYLPGVELPDGVTATTVAELDLAEVDLVCLAVPSRAFRETVEQVADRLPSHADVLLLTKGLVPPDAQLPCDYLAGLTGSRSLALLGGPAHAAEACRGEAGLVVASPDRSFAARLVGIFQRAGLRCERSEDLVGVQLAGCAKNAAALAVGLALPNGVNAAGTAAGRIYGECHELARSIGAGEDSFTGLAGAGDLVATVLAPHSRNRRAGELLADGASVPAIERALGQTSEALDLIPLLAAAMREQGMRAPATHELARLVESRRRPEASTDGPEIAPAEVPAGIAPAGTATPARFARSASAA
jgi:glycerol-3-phosphate dehydrogenase (NAD(P)+)